MSEPVTGPLMGPISAIQQPTDADRRAAAAWFVRLDQLGAHASERAAFAEWCVADPNHQVAFDEVSRLWGQLAAPAAVLAAAEAPRYAALIAKGRPSSVPRASWWLRPGYGLAAAMAAVLVTLACWLALPSLGGVAQNMMADASTGPGERRAIALPDGSIVELAGNSAIDISFDATQRQVMLRRGEAFFEVRPGLATPFLVDAGAGWARVVGTSFDVRRDDARVTVTVATGRVAVGTTGRDTRDDTGDDTGGDTWATLTVGTQASVETGPNGDTVLSAVMPADLDRTLAWRQDRLIFKRETLAAVVEELAHYADARIVIWRPELRDVRISGTFPTTDTSGTLDAIVDTLALQRLDVTPWLTILY
nr:FecR domain-containing protein [uncultured Dongia sp.]